MQITLDERYSQYLEWCGCPRPKYTARFCDDLLGYFDTQQEAITTCLEHRRNSLFEMGLL